MVGNYNKRKFDKTKWYSIDRDRFNELMEKGEWSNRLGQNEPTIGSKWTNGAGQNEPTYTREFSDSSTSDSNINIGQPDKKESLANEDNPEWVSSTDKVNESEELENKMIGDKIKQVVEHLNKITNKNYKTTTKATQKLIRARLNEGFTVDDFKKVIELKAAQWANDQQMSQYLRPSTLFHESKFEGYLNEQSLKNQENGQNGCRGQSIIEQLAEFL